MVARLGSVASFVEWGKPRRTRPMDGMSHAKHPSDFGCRRTKALPLMRERVYNGCVGA